MILVCVFKMNKIYLLCIKVCLNRNMFVWVLYALTVNLMLHYRIMPMQLYTKHFFCVLLIKTLTSIQSVLTVHHDIMSSGICRFTLLRDSVSFSEIVNQCFGMHPKRNKRQPLFSEHKGLTVSSILFQYQLAIKKLCESGIWYLLLVNTTILNRKLENSPTGVTVICCILTTGIPKNYQSAKARCSRLKSAVIRCC